MSTGTPPAPPRAPLSADAARAVLDYLRSRGYRQAEAALRAEQAQLAPPPLAPLDAAAADQADLDDDLRGVIAALRRGSAADDASVYDEAYCELRDWVDGSLDLYKAELHAILYPLLVHCFLEMVRRERVDDARAFLARCSAEFAEDAAAAGAPGRREELVSLAGIASEQHLEENEAAKLFLNNRYELHLSSYAFELVISFLADDPRRAVLLRILNMRCRVRLDADADYAARTGVPTRPRDKNASGGFVGDEEKARYIKRSEILWGRLTPELYMISDEEAANGVGGSGVGAGAAGAAAGFGNGAGGARDKGKKGGVGGAAGSVGGGGSSCVGSGAGAKVVDAAARKGSDLKGDGSAKKVAGGKAGDGKGDAMDVDGEEEEDVPPHVRPDGTLSEALIPLKRYRQGAKGLETPEDLKARAPLGDVQKLQEAAEAAAAAAAATGKEGDDSTAVAPLLTAGKEIVNGMFLPSVLCYTYTNTRSDGLNCSALSPDGSKVAAGFGDSTLRLWDARASGTAAAGAGSFGSQAVRLIGHSGPVYSVDWSKCARFVLSGSEDGTVRLWSAVTNADLVAYRGHNYPVWSVGFSPLDHYFASSSHDRSARIWVTDRVYPLRILAGHLADVDVVRWHPNCTYVATGSSDRTVRLWDLRDGGCTRVFGSQSGAIQSLAFSPDGRTLAVAGESRDIELWDISLGTRVTTLRGHTKAVWSLDYSKDGSVLASGGADNTVRLWRADQAAVGAAAGAADAGAGGVNANGVAASSPVLGKRVRGGRIGGGGAGEAGKSSALLATLRTKKTPIHLVHFTRRNLLIAAGSFSP